MAVVYIHRKETNNEIFYVGIGANEKRPYQKHKSHRNKWWLNIVNKHGRTVEILEKDLTIEEARESEMALIELIGRKDLGLGPLVNLTDGGEGAFNKVYKKVIHIKSGRVFNNLSMACREFGICKNAERVRMRGLSHLRNFKILGDVRPENLGPYSRTHKVTGVIYRSLKDACDKLGLNYNNEKYKYRRNKSMFEPTNKNNEKNKD